MRTLGRLLALSAAFIVGCGGDAPPALSVGGVAYTEDELLGLSVERRQLLANLVGVGLAIADSSGAELGQPLVDAWLEDRRGEILAAELTLEQYGVEDAVLEARYLTDPDWELTVRHILFFSERWRSPAHRGPPCVARSPTRRTESRTSTNWYRAVCSSLSAATGTLPSGRRCSAGVRYPQAVPDGR